MHTSYTLSLHADRVQCERSQGAERCNRCIVLNHFPCMPEYKIRHPAPREAAEVLAESNSAPSASRNTNGSLSYPNPTSSHTKRSDLAYTPVAIGSMGCSMAIGAQGLAPAAADTWGQYLQPSAFLPNTRMLNSGQSYASSIVAMHPPSMQSHLRYPENRQDDPTQSIDGQHCWQDLSWLRRNEPPDEMGYMNGTGTPRGTLGDTEQYNRASPLRFGIRPAQHSHGRARSRSPRRKADQTYRDRPGQL